MPVVKRAQRLFLDTHVWIWLAEGDDRLSVAFRKMVDSARERDGIFVSVISTWELGMLVAKKRLKLDAPASNWVDIALAQKGITLCPLTPEIALDSTDLPGSKHGDPADRMLIATARSHGVPLATADKVILKYGRGTHLRVLDPRQ